MDLVIHGAVSGEKEVRTSTTGHFDIWAAHGDGHVACNGEGEPLQVMTRGGAAFLVIDWAAKKTTIDWNNVPRIDVAERKKAKEKAEKKEAEADAEHGDDSVPKEKKKKAKDATAPNPKKRPHEEEKLAAAPPAAKKARVPLTPEQLQARREKMAAKKAIQQANLEKIVDTALAKAGLGESDE